MDSKSLINETLKYLEKDSNNKPKYRFEVYKVGMANYYKNQLSALTFGLKKFDAEEEEKVPVSVYTIGDVFDTMADVKDDVMTNIQALPDTLDNIKVSLKQLGFTALDSTINVIKTAVIPIEVIQVVESVYRIAKPLVEKIVNIASIKFHFENAALVAQDVLQYLSRLAVSTAQNLLNKLWNIFMDTPIFAIYENENGDVINLADIYADLSDAANQIITELSRNADAVYDMITYINYSEFNTYEPKYNEFGITVPEDIIDVYHDINTRKIYIATKKAVYQINENFSTSKIFDVVDSNLEKIYVNNNEIYYVSKSDIKFTIRKWDGENLIPVGQGIPRTSSEEIDIIFSNPLILYIKGTTKLYNADGIQISVGTGGLIPITKGIVYQCYDVENNTIYYISIEDSANHLWQITSAEDEDGKLVYYPEHLYKFNNFDVYGLRYFNKDLYIVVKNDFGKYHMVKVDAGKSFIRESYKYENFTLGDRNIIWTDGEEFATDGSNIFTLSNNKTLTYAYNIDMASCVTRKNYQGRNYLVCSGGNKIHIALDEENYKWYDKIIDAGIEDAEEKGGSLLDNMAGCLWFNNSYGDNFIVYSQQNVYVFGPREISQIFEFVDTRTIPDLLTKEYGSFDDWWDNTSSDPGSVFIVPSSMTKVGEESDGCIITAIRVIGNKPYIALFSPKNDKTKCGIYPCSITRESGVDTFIIDYLHPVFTSNKKVKIYSFNKRNSEWYYTDGKALFNITTNSSTDFKMAEFGDGLLTITDDINLYSAKAFLKSSQVETRGKITSLVKYECDNLPEIASTRNIMMFSDGNYVYSIVDNGEDAIDYDMFQICYKNTANDYKLIQSNDAAFIVSKNAIKKLPFYSSIDSCEYGCGYYTDTTPNKWHNAAPYYFVSNVLNERKNSQQRDIFLFSFKENFKVELDKLLTNMPDAFISYARERLITELKKININIDGDDGQILDVIRESVASTTATSLGMYINEKFMEKVGDDTTYDTFATTVYRACKADAENNMTKQFYDIFKELANSIIKAGFQAKELTRDGMTKALLSYYQNHKAEWAKSMTDLIDVDAVDPEYYEIPLVAERVTLSEKTMRFSYDDNDYKFEFISNPSVKFSSQNIISGYYYEGKFYADSEHTQEIDARFRDENGDYHNGNSTDGSIICYYNPKDENYYRYKLMDYNLTEDEEVVPGKGYYVKTGDDTYNYNLSSDTAEQNKPYFTRTLVNTSDTKVDSEKEYYKKGDNEFNYEPVDSSYYGGDYIRDAGDTYFIYNPTSGNEKFFVTFIPFVPDVGETPEEGDIEYSGPLGDYILSSDGYYVYEPGHTDIQTYTIATYMSSNGILKLDSYYEKGIYFQTEDTEVNPDKKYYAESFIPASGDVSSSVQYYEYDYEKTKDSVIDPTKEYYEYVDTSYVITSGSDGYVPYSEGDEGERYRANYVQLNDVFDDNETYFIKGDDGKYIVAEELNIQNVQAYYYIDGMVADPNGDYIKIDSSHSIGDSYFNKVANPKTDDLSTYYELVIKPIAKPSTIEGKYVKVYTEVANPIITDIESYFEKSDEYTPATNVNYAYDEFGVCVGVINDRNYYKATFTEGDFELITEPSGNPYEQNWYEHAFTQVEPGTIENPVAEGLYERTSNPIVFEKIENPSGNPKQQGWYEYSDSYSTLYDDGKVYINLDPKTVISNFPELDAAWHEMFYDRLDEISNNLPEDFEEAKYYALDEIAKINYKFQPAWEWKALITQSVSELYIPQQGEQYRQIILNSNMYPIQWNELPVDIDTETFDYALTALLYAIKQRLLTNISILVDNGKVKCFSCIDASTVIDRIIGRNANIWTRQGNQIKTKIQKASDKDDIIAALDATVMFDPTLFLLENILVDQSKLYAKYIDMIIDEQVIKDNDTEVML